MKKSWNNNEKTHVKILTMATLVYCTAKKQKK